MPTAATTAATVDRTRWSTSPDNKTAHVSYIAIAEKNDQQGVTHNDGKYFAYISVMDNDIKRGESGNPVRTLRMRYDAWVKSGSPRLAPPPPTLYRPTT